MVGKCGCTSGMMGNDDGMQTVMGKVRYSCVVEGMSTRLREPPDLLSYFVGVGEAAVELQRGSKTQNRDWIGRSSE